MKNIHMIKSAVLLSSSLTILSMVNYPAQAAFEWTPPAEEQPLVPMVQDQPGEEVQNTVPQEEPQISSEQILPGPVMLDIAPAEIPKAVVAEDLQNLIIEAEKRNDITPIAPIPETEQVDVNIEEDSSVSLVKESEITPEVTKLVPEPEIDMVKEQMPQEPDTIVRGFGTDLPLVSAVRQIVPDGISYSFGEGVDLSKPVSWQSGATWQETLNSIADAQGLVVSYMGQEIRLSSSSFVMAKPEESVVENSDPAAVALNDTVKVPSEVVANMPNVIESSLKDMASSDKVLMAEGTIIQNDNSEISDIKSMLLGSEIVVVPEEITPNVMAETEVMEAVVDTLPLEEVTPFNSQKINELAANIEAEEVAVVVNQPETITESPLVRNVADLPIFQEVEQPQQQSAIIPVMSQKNMPEEIIVMPDVKNIAESKEVVMLVPDESMPPMDLTAESIQELAAIGEVKTWKVRKNSDLKKTLEEWSEESGVSLQWNMSQDYKIGYMVWVDGNLEEAVQTVMQGYANEQGIIPSARFEMDTSGQPVLVIDPEA